eukprot:2416296-Amphidinium_carterae.1
MIRKEKTLESVNVGIPLASDVRTPESPKIPPNTKKQSKAKNEIEQVSMPEFFHSRGCIYFWGVQGYVVCTDKQEAKNIHIITSAHTHANEDTLCA